MIQGEGNAFNDLLELKDATGVKITVVWLQENSTGDL